MTLTIEVPPELEERLQSQAEKQGQDVQAYALAVLAREAGQLTHNGKPMANQLSARQQAAQRGYGMLKGDGHTVDDFLRERREEADMEMQQAARRDTMRNQQP